MKIIEITEANAKGEICESILRSLPEWFGIESAIKKYVKDVESQEMWAGFNEETAVGFVAVHTHFPQSAEVHVMGIRPEFHRQGIGHQLLEQAEAHLLDENVQFLTVKTLSASRPNKEYDQTRNFYLKAGFVPLEEFKTLWNEDNPCLFLVKDLRKR